MANVNNPHGLQPLGRRESGGNPELRSEAKSVSLQGIFKWDPVTRVAGVLHGPADTSGNAITPGTTRYLGVVHGGATQSGSTPWWTALTAATLLVEESPDSLFEVQGDGSGSGGNVIAATTIGFNANLNLTSVTGGTETRDSSGVQLTESTIAATATLDVTILALLNEIDNAYGVNARVEVKFNKHLMNNEVTKT